MISFTTTFHSSVLLLYKKVTKKFGYKSRSELLEDILPRVTCIFLNSLFKFSVSQNKQGKTDKFNFLCMEQNAKKKNVLRKMYQLCDFSNFVFNHLKTCIATLGTSLTKTFLCKSVEIYISASAYGRALYTA